MPVRETMIFKIELPGHLKIPFEQASLEENLRAYVYERSQRILPGDIRLECLENPQDSGGWLIDIWETADLPEQREA